MDRNRSKPAKQIIVCAVVYRHPNENIQSFQNKQCDTLLSLENEKNFVYSLW